MLAELDGAYYESFSLAMVRALIALQTGAMPAVEPGFPEAASRKSYSGLEWIKVGPLRIPVDDTPNARVPYRRHKVSFPYISPPDPLPHRGNADAPPGD